MNSRSANRIWLKSAFYLGLAVSGLLSVASAALAQIPPAESPVPHIDQGETVEKMAEALGIPPTSRFYRQFAAEFGRDLRKADLELRRKGKQHADDPSMKEEDQAPENTTEGEPPPRPIDRGGTPKQPRPDLPVIKHYRAGFGIDLPKREEVYNPLKMDREEIKKRIKEYLAEAEPAILRAYTAQPLPACTEAKTDRSKLTSITSEKVDKASRSRILMDVLYITPEQQPLNKENVFGEKTRVNVYKPGTRDKASVLAQVSGVPCLPYRVRVTGEYRFVHYGMDALRNYDKNQHGKGILQNSMKD